MKRKLAIGTGRYLPTSTLVHKLHGQVSSKEVLYELMLVLEFDFSASPIGLNRLSWEVPTYGKYLLLGKVPAVLNLKTHIINKEPEEMFKVKLGTGRE